MHCDSDCPEGATYTSLGHRPRNEGTVLGTQSTALASLNSPFQGYFNGGFITRGFAPLYPGLLEFTPSGLKSRKKVDPSASSGTRLKVGAGHQGGGEHNFLLHIFTSLQRKQRFFKYLFNIHTLFLRLRFRLVRQEIPLRVGFQIRRSLWTKERAPFGKLRDRGSSPVRLHSSQMRGIQKDKQQKE